MIPSIIGVNGDTSQTHCNQQSPSAPRPEFSYRNPRCKYIYTNGLDKHTRNGVVNRQVHEIRLINGSIIRFCRQLIAVLRVDQWNIMSLDET